MTNITKKGANAKRSSNLEALMQVPKEQLNKLVKQLTSTWEVQPVALGQAGLGLLKLEDGAFHEPFYLGEFPLATAHLSITLPNSDYFEGAAMMMGDDQTQVESLALCDAILSHDLEGYEMIQRLVFEGQVIRQQEIDKRSATLAKTRVDFSLIGDTGDNHEC